MQDKVLQTLLSHYFFARLEEQGQEKIVSEEVLK